MNRGSRTGSSVNKSGAGSKATKKAPTDWRDRMSPERYEELRDVFLIFDEDGSGEIDPQEISKVLDELGVERRNSSNVIPIIQALRQTNKKLTFEEFVDVVCSYAGEVRTKDGLRRVFNHYDKEGTGMIEFEQLKAMARHIGEVEMTDDDLLNLMHAVFINHSTTSNESFSFDEFYMVISNYYSRPENQRDFY